MILFRDLIHNQISEVTEIYCDEGDILVFDSIEFDEELLWVTDKPLKFATKDIDELLNKIPTIDLNKIDKVIFNHCKFQYDPIIAKHQIDLLEFNYCSFSRASTDLMNTMLKTNDNDRKNIIFNNCDFERFNIGNIKYANEVKLCKFYFKGGIVKNLTIKNVELITKIYFNRQYEDNQLKTEIENLIIENTVFKENFKLHHCNIKNISIKNTDFKKQADFYKSSFHNGTNEYNDKTIYLKALNFEGLTIFGHCDFTKKVVFSSVTFGDFVHFKEANFENGLDLDYTNIQKEMNFFGVKGLDSTESQVNTSQETYRIIKHNFKKIGNQIEANKYHALELNVHRQDIWYQIKQETWYKVLNLSFPHLDFYFDIKKILKLGLDMLPSLVHRASSNYGQSWLLPLIWILIVGLITNCVISECNWGNAFNFREILKHVSIINLDVKLKEYPAIFLFNKISLGYLYYQFIIATRKNTKK